MDCQPPETISERLEKCRETSARRGRRTDSLRRSGGRTADSRKYNLPARLGGELEKLAESMAFRRRHLARGLVMLAFACVTMTGCGRVGSFMDMLAPAGDDAFCEPAEYTGYTVTDGKRTDEYRQKCPDWKYRSPSE